MLTRACPLALLLLAACPPANSFSLTTLPQESSGEASGSGGDSSSSSSSTSSSESSGDAGSGSGGMTTGEQSSSGGAASTTQTGTTGTPPVCGDGVQDEGEECDDGDDDNEDDCSTSCFRSRTVFATSMMWQPKINGMMGAIGLCRQLAAKAGLANYQTFDPWLSDSKTNAIDNVWRGKGRYKRVDGVTVAKDFDALLAGPLLAPINVDEFGMPAPGGVMTGTLPDGTRVPETTFCNDWFGAGPFEKQLWYGNTDATDAWWTFVDDPDVSPSICSGDWRLLCFEGK